MWLKLPFEPIFFGLRKKEHRLVIHGESVLYGRGHTVWLVPNYRISENPFLLVYHTNCEAVGLEHQAFWQARGLRQIPTPSLFGILGVRVAVSGAFAGTQIGIPMIPPHCSRGLENSF